MSNYYDSLFGFKCQTESNKIILYPIELLEIFKDPITFELINDPILINQFPNIVYDKNSLMEWFYHSNKEPFCGIELNKFIKFTPILNFYIALSLLEKKDDLLIFHQPNIDLINLYELMSCVISSNNKKQNNVKFLNKYKNLNINHDTIQLDLEYYNCFGIEKDKKYFEQYYDFTLQDLLLNDFKTGKTINNPIITGNIIMDVSTLIEKSSIKLESIEKFIVGKKGLDCSIIFNNIKDKFESLGIDYFIKERNCNKEDELFSFLNIFINEKSLKLRQNDKFLSCNKTYEYIYEQYSNLIKNININYKDFDKKKAFLSQMIKKDLMILTKQKCGWDGILENYKKDINFPVLSLCEYYSEDFSLLDLDNLEIKTDSVLKGFDFIGTNFENTKLVDISFSSNAFIASNLINSRFINCDFDNTVFYKTITKNTTFLNCRFDKKTLDMINKEFFENIFIIKNGSFIIN